MEVGNRIVLDGKEVTVTGRAASGRHVQWTLSDGRTIPDLHLNTDIQVVDGAAPAPSQGAPGAVGRIHGIGMFTEGNGPSDPPNETGSAMSRKKKGFGLVDSERPGAIGEDLHD